RRAGAGPRLDAQAREIAGDGRRDRDGWGVGPQTGNVEAIDSGEQAGVGDDRMWRLGADAQRIGGKLAPGRVDAQRLDPILAWQVRGSRSESGEFQRFAVG